MLEERTKGCDEMVCFKRAGARTFITSQSGEMSLDKYQLPNLESLCQCL
jgi:hypothetical protein